MRIIAGAMYDAGRALENASAMVRWLLLLWETGAKPRNFLFSKTMYIRTQII